MECTVMFLKRYFIRLLLFHFMEHELEKTASCSKIVTKSQRVFCKYFRTRLRLFHFKAHIAEKTKSDKISL